MDYRIGCFVYRSNLWQKKLKELLSFNTLSQIMAALETTEADLISNWKTYIERNI
jgi:hypothetical protein